ncbi:MAG: MaoC/PaaZ C-terminal domain-containing protein [Planctomycetota bacterium]
MRGRPADSSTNISTTPEFTSPAGIAKPTGFVLPISTTQTLCLEDLEVGQQWTSPSREITADDVADFASLTGDNDPLHREQPDAGLPFRKPIAHGLLGLGVMAGLSADHPRVSTLALTSLENWTFEAPIYFGDEVRVRTSVAAIEPHGRRAGKVTWLRELVNQDGRVVQQGHLVTLVATKSRRSSMRLHDPISGSDSEVARIQSASCSESPLSSTGSQRGKLPAR